MQLLSKCNSRIEHTSSALNLSSASIESIQSYLALFAPLFLQVPYPSHADAIIVAPCCVASSTVASLLPESTTMISSVSSLAEVIQSTICACSFLVNMTTDKFTTA